MAEMVEKVAKAICRAIVEKDAAEAQFAYSGVGYHDDGSRRHAQLDIDIEREIEEAWPDYVHAAQLAIKESTETFVRVRDWNHDEAWQARNAYDSAVREIDAALSYPKEEGDDLATRPEDGPTAPTGR